ncbi:MAG: hypothetical protein JOZ47_04965 [Kutzneria sp.]|nr:hypothetical protein [Kutzneria sp.]
MTTVGLISGGNISGSGRPGYDAVDVGGPPKAGAAFPVTGSTARCPLCLRDGIAVDWPL